MYFYCYSFGEYEQYTENIYMNEKLISEKEWKQIIEKYLNDKEKLKELGFTELNIDVWVHAD